MSMESKIKTRKALNVARCLLPATREFDDHRCIKAIASALLRAEALGISWAMEVTKETYMDTVLNDALESERNCLEAEAASLDSSVEVVNHKDGDPRNNNLSNLEIKRQ